MRALLNIVGILGLVVFGALLAASWAVRRSLPPERETRAVEGLAAAVTIEVDSVGVPVIRAASLADLAFGQGYAHARDRRFQMELTRRAAAGRLAEVFGRVALGNDRLMRTYGFAVRAESALARTDADTRELFERYAAGVNAWDRAHPAPPEMEALGIPREPWRASDCVLAVLAMFEQLNDTGASERAVEQMDATLHPALVEFLLPAASPWDVALDGWPAPAPPRLPRPDEVDLRRTADTTRAAGAAAGPAAALPAPAAPWRDPGDERDAGERLRGSNNWAIAPSRTRGGTAILAGDPHLGISVPVIWHRQRLEGGGLAITGVTLPGLPGVIIGSNGHVAWSLTNVEPDVADLVRVEYAAPDSSHYLGPGGPEPFRLRRETIPVRGGADETLLVRETRWGPVTGASVRGGGLALQWTALAPDMPTEGLFALDAARTVEEFLAALPTYRGPPQNFVLADREGRIAWRIGGWFPRRSGFDPRRPREGADPGAGWDGWIGPDSLPKVVDPPQGFIVTANQRTVGGPALRVVGSGYTTAFRAARIRDALASRRDWTADDVATLQNDIVDEVLLGPTAAALERALAAARPAGDGDGATDTLAVIRRILGGWTRRADSTSVAHALLRRTRTELHRVLTDPLVAPVRTAHPSYSYDWPLVDEVARRLLEERPLHLLDPAFESYDAAVLAAARRALVWLEARDEARAAEATPWGAINRARYHHPLGALVKPLGRWLNMPDVALAGGGGVVRVAGPRAGASLRMVVDLGEPGAARFALPGGQSGHFLSPHYSDSFDEWVAGRTQALEPGPAVGRIRLEPRTAR